MSQSIDTILGDGSVISFDYLNSRKNGLLLSQQKPVKYENPDDCCRECTVD